MKPLVYSVLPRPAHPTRDGLAIRNYHLLAAISREFRVRAFVLAGRDARGAGEYPAAVDVEEIPRRGGRLDRAAALAKSLVSGEAFPVLLYQSSAMAKRLKTAVASETPAWIVAHSYHVAPGGLAAGVPAWVDFHNVDSEIWRRLGEEGSGVEAAAARWQAPRVARAESRIASKAAGVSCVSERDARALREAGAKDPLEVPNGVDLDRYAFRPDPPAGQTVFFVGDLSWPPNADGIAWFCEEIWPLVARLAPAARVEILGRGAAGRLSRFLRNPPARVSFAGEGGDTRPYWSRASVAIVPLKAGGGTRLKILEAAASGVPVISTRVGAEGLGFEPGSEILLADEPEEFATTVARLLSDPDSRRSLAAAARRRVEATYDWRAAGAVLARALLAGASRA
ncbi:MAG TPA: glycosyltransferase [Thermoanaerobaculia bacterium]|nr:glycosyltransferase [Thermoanaerobaculia bacterium]